MSKILAVLSPPLLAACLPFPGVGHVRKEPKGYAWVPVEFAPSSR